MGRLRAQGAVEYLLIMTLVLIILAWSIYNLRVAKRQHENLADFLSSSEDRFNEKIRSEISSSLDSS
ncbi:class III signal peptide-containing protein [Thermococcus pacificus]|uniref:Class III signal peptide-containing protein n=1 Tax=Thermococcus pacificus TaxID=71998 RepID=A0A218P852_9EURY|nr:class III signal peptide-containing protein [Thermococcus pacificus]ASJ06967.1 hypothetical protein A3L08_06335 [Thermococcus pacificus]